ncbi:MAG: hypothetical protein RI894_1083 [Bacteroidota bacterium]|jgi:hypothetical protein
MTKKEIAISATFLLLTTCLTTSCQSLFSTSFGSETPNLKYYDVASITAIATNSVDTVKKGYILLPIEKETFFNAVAAAAKTDIKVAGAYRVQIHLKSGGMVEIGASKDRLFKAKTGVYTLSESSPTFAEYFKK